MGDPFVVLFELWEFFGFDITGPANRDLVLFLDIRGEEFFRGAWGWFAVVVVQSVFNSVLREYLLFRGLLLPRVRRSDQWSPSPSGTRGCRGRWWMR